MKIIPLACALCVVAAACTGAGPIPVPVAEPGIVHFPDNERIPPEALAEMFRAELGPAYDPVQAGALAPAHALVEKYFHIRSGAGRKQVVTALEATKVSPNVLGRIARIRADWPALAGGGIFYVNEKPGAYPVRYFLGVPKGYDRTKPWPIAVTLAGSQPFQTDPPPDAKRVVELYTGWIQTELAKHPDALVLMPLLSLEELYGPSYAGMHSVMKPLLDAADHVNIDPARAYLAGISMGAQASWNLALHYPTYFAAFNPLAGTANEDWQRVRLMNLRNVLPVVWHDDDDKVVKVNFSKSLVTELKRLKIDVDFSETKGVGHYPTPEIVEAAYQKMRQHARNLYPPEVWIQTSRPDVMFNRSDWVQIYQELNPGKTGRLFFPRSSGYMTVYSESCSVKADVKNNVITATADNVETARFYVNDQMVNFAAPVTLIVNKRERFKGVLKPSVDEMLRDQINLGRGWRYYTAAIDLTTVESGPSSLPATRPATRPLQRGRIIVGPPPDKQP